jgi:NAD(P)-dependent dehydrogenase (short-subunit alcohol dehydrogenase family)
MKTYLIVGGTSGITAAITDQALTAGHQVYLATRQSSVPAGVHLLPYDAESPSKLELPERIDHFIYCPGTITLKPFHSLKPEIYQKDMEVNTFGAIPILQQALPTLKRSDAPSILFFSSVAARKGLPYHVSISMAKAAVEGLTVSLAAELAPKIRVNAIAPSLTDTKLAEPLLNSEAKMEASANRHPLKRVGSPEDVANLADLLLNSPFTTGQIVHIDGGLSTIS